MKVCGGPLFPFDEMREVCSCNGYTQYPSIVKGTNMVACPLWWKSMKYSMIPWWMLFHLIH